MYKFRKKKIIFFLPQDIYGFVFQETYIYIHSIYPKQIQRYGEQV